MKIELRYLTTAGLEAWRRPDSRHLDCSLAQAP